MWKSVKEALIIAAIVLVCIFLLFMCRDMALEGAPR